MCELYAVSSAQEVVLNQTLSLFYQHSVKHPHGWGLAYWEAGQAVLYKEEVSALESAFLQRLLEKEIRSKIALGHIRFATVGKIGPVNCHPFTGQDNSGRQWTLIHNGTMFNGVELIPYEARQTGQTDSERILLYLLDRINEAAKNKGSPLLSGERIRVVEKSASALAPRNKLNLLLYDSEQLYVHTNMKDTLHWAQQDGACYFATAPLENDFSWQKLPLNTLMAYQDGVRIYQGTPHSHEYVKADLRAVGNFQI